MNGAHADMMTGASPKDQEHRAIIVHCHMFKNAGSTFDWSLNRCFRGDFLDHRDDTSMKQGAAYLGPFLEENSSLRAISTHALMLPLPNVPSARLLPVFFLRHPIERVWSVYAFERRQPEDTPGSLMARKLSFQDYVSWRVDPNTPATLRNFQTRCCVPGLRLRARRPIGDAEMAAAVKTLQDTPLVGIVDLFDESMTVMEAALQEYFADIDLAYVPQNIGIDRIDSEIEQIPLPDRISQSGNIYYRSLEMTDRRTAQRAQWVLDNLNNETAERLLEVNQQDLHLYWHARRLVLDRFAGLEACRERLAGFKRRCNALHDLAAEKP